jgi:hypothetical protein
MSFTLTMRVGIYPLRLRADTGGRRQRRQRLQGRLAVIVPGWLSLGGLPHGTDQAAIGHPPCPHHYQHERLTFRFSGRDFRLTDVHGRVVREIVR